MASRIPPSQVLEHPFRQALLDRIRAAPGTAFLDLFHHFKQDPTHSRGLGYGSLMYHLQQLERGRHITTRKSGRFRRHYENGGPWNGDTSALALLQTPTAARLARIVLAEPGLHQAAIWKRFCQDGKMTRQAVGYQLDRMAEHGLVVLSKDGAASHFHATEKLERLLGFLEPAGKNPAQAGPFSGSEPTLGADALAPQPTAVGDVGA